MFLASSQTALSNEHIFMKPSKSANSYQYQKYTSQKQLDELYQTEIYSTDTSSTKIAQGGLSVYGISDNPNLSYYEEASLDRKALGSINYDTSSASYVKVESGEAVRPEYGIESPLHAYQNFNDVGMLAPKDNYKRQYENSTGVMIREFTQSDPFELQRDSDLYGEREYSEYGPYIHPRQHDEQLQHPLQQYLPPGQVQLVPQQQFSKELKPLSLPPTQQGYEYPDMTTMVNASTEVVGPMVEMQFVDLKVCRICNKRITRDMCRHMRTHQSEKRFVCVFPKHTCGNKSNQFNRRYDYTKHLLNKHFVYDNPEVAKSHTVREKVSHWGTCVCGQRFLAQDWIDSHVLTKNEGLKCPIIRAANSV